VEFFLKDDAEVLRRGGGGRAGRGGGAGGGGPPESNDRNGKCKSEGEVAALKRECASLARKTHARSIRFGV
jgi:hypothetical protein